jgi:hypothetical protein
MGEVKELFEMIFGFAGTSSGVGESGEIRSPIKDKENYVPVCKVVSVNYFRTQSVK